MIFRNKWSNWIDVSIGKVHEHVYLLQYRRQENGKVEFMVEKSNGIWGIETPNLSDLQFTKEAKP